jgi:hypothetical protein
MLSILSEKIQDGRFLGLITNMLSAGYLEDWQWNATLSGAPQGGVASPVLSNIYLNKLDNFVETVLIPQYTRGKIRKLNPAYNKANKALVDARNGGTGVRPGSSGRRSDALHTVILVIPATVGCATPATPTIISWASSDRRPKPRRSRPNWPSSCATISSWNSPPKRP